MPHRALIKAQDIDAVHGIDAERRCVGAFVMALRTAISLFSGLAEHEIDASATYEIVDGRIRTVWFHEPNPS